METLWTRRDMMKGLGIAALAMGMGGPYGSAHAQSRNGKERGKTITGGECLLPPLPYPYDALEPYIDKETLTIHHDLHHAGYVKKFNTALKKLTEARASGDYSLIKHWSGELAFNGSGHVLHSLYWGSMSPREMEPGKEFLDAIYRNFGSIRQFELQFAAATGAVEGSGWGILAYEPYMGHLVILQCENHQDLTIWGVHPLLVCDVWEHAYYLKYKNKRSDYIKNFIKIINWKEVERRYSIVKGLTGYR